MRKLLAVASILISLSPISPEPAQAYDVETHTCRIMSQSTSVTIHNRPNGSVVKKVARGTEFQTSKSFTATMDGQVVDPGWDPVVYDAAGKMWVRFQADSSNTLGYVAADLVQCRSQGRGWLNIDASVARCLNLGSPPCGCPGKVCQDLFFGPCEDEPGC